MKETCERKVVLGFFAHPDDAEIFAGGTLVRLGELGWEVHIATATGGDCGSATLGREAISKIRRGEGKAAAELIGGRYHCLLENDLKVVYEAGAIGKAIDLFREVNPSLVLTHPRADYMIDHEQVHLLGRGASFGFGIPNASERPVGEGHIVPWLYYVDPMEGIDPYTGERVVPTVNVDITGVIERKLEMLACHESQREWLRAHHGIDEYLIATRKHSAMRGECAGVEYAESFVQHRGHPYPQMDLLAELLGKG